jgi:hypothetical protein
MVPRLGVSAGVRDGDLAFAADDVIVITGEAGDPDWWTGYVAARPGTSGGHDDDAAAAAAPPHAERGGLGRTTRIESLPSNYVQRIEWAGVHRS